MKLYKHFTVREGYGFEELAWITHVTLLGRYGSQEIKLGWMMFIMLPSFSWEEKATPDDPLNQKGGKWFQRCIRVKCVDERGFPAPWEWSMGEFPVDE